MLLLSLCRAHPIAHEMQEYHDISCDEYERHKRGETDNMRSGRKDGKHKDTETTQHNPDHRFFPLASFSAFLARRSSSRLRLRSASSARKISLQATSHSARVSGGR